MAIGSLLTIIGAYIQSQSADRRLKTQLDHEVEQRRAAAILDVNSESISHLEKLINVAIDSMPLFVEESTEGVISFEIATPVISAVQRAEVAMMGIQDSEALAEVRAVQLAFRPIIAEVDPQKRLGLAPNLTLALGALDRRCTALKNAAITKGSQ